MAGLSAGHHIANAMWAPTQSLVCVLPLTRLHGLGAGRCIDAAGDGTARVAPCAAGRRAAQAPGRPPSAAHRARRAPAAGGVQPAVLHCKLESCTDCPQQRRAGACTSSSVATKRRLASSPSDWPQTGTMRYTAGSAVQDLLLTHPMPIVLPLHGRWALAQRGSGRRARQRRTGGYLLCRRGRGRGGHVDVVLARDADDADVTEAFAAALFTCGTLPLPAGQVWSCHPSTHNDRAADRNRAATNSEFCLRHESGERAEVACGLAGLDHQQNVAETKGSCEVQWDNKADPAQAWLQLHWAAFVKQLGCARLGAV